MQCYDAGGVAPGVLQKDAKMTSTANGKIAA
jgi:hypothetical protein